MTREDVFELMQEEIDGQISEEKKAILLAAIKEDPELNQYYNAYREIQSGMLELEAEPPEGLARGVMYRIRNGEKKPRRFSFGYGTLAAAAVLLVLLVGSGVLKQVMSKSAADSSGQVNTVYMAEETVAASDMNAESPKEAAFEAALAEAETVIDSGEPEMKQDMILESKSESSLTDHAEEAMSEPAAAPYDSSQNDTLLPDARKEDGEMPISEAEEEPDENKVSILRVYLHGEKAADVAPDEFLFPFDQGYWFESTLENAYAFEAALPEACEAEFDLTDEADDASLILIWLIED